MKETRLGPRQWAFVVVVGGATLALPFTQRRPELKPALPDVDVASTLLPEASGAVPAVMASATNHSPADQATSKNGLSAAPVPGLDELATAPAVPVWPTLLHSPFDELVQQKAVVVEAEPTEEIVPMQPLRPWISAPGLAGNSLASTSNQRIGSPSVSTAPALGGPRDSVGDPLGSPWRDDEAADEVEQQVVASYGHGRRQLPVTAGPADQYTYEELAQKLNLPKEDLADRESTRESLLSAIVPADQVLPVPPIASQPSGGASGSYPLASTGQSGLRSIPKSTVVLSRQPGPRSPGVQVRFGQTESSLPPAALSSPAPDSTMVPLPTLPDERRGHVIYQPRRS